MQKPVRRVISGILLLDKHIGISSNNALQKAKYLLQAKKAGHTGSLDPLATGMLPICFGEGTKFSQYLLDADKTYEVTLQLGVRTSTSDAEGEVVATKPVPTFSSAQIEAALQQFRGQIEQVPSMYSALKHQGKPLYQYAREGITIERPPRPITVYQLDCLEQTALTLTLRVHCSKGTYIRTIVDDLGEVLGCGAHVTALRRSAVGQYAGEHMVTLDALEAMSLPERDALLLDISTTLTNLPEIQLTAEMTLYMRHGQAVFVSGAPTAGLVKLVGADGAFLGVGKIALDGKIQPSRLVATGH